jgi:mannose PTS system EIIA component
MIGILVISHEPLGTALIRCTRHVFGKLPALDIIPDEDPALAQQTARDLLNRINDGTGALVFTDVFGATPSRIARALGEPHRVEVLAGVNLPMLLKALSLRREGMPMEEMVEQLLESARSAVMRVELLAPVGAP